LQISAAQIALPGALAGVGYGAERKEGTVVPEACSSVGVPPVECWGAGLPSPRRLSRYDAIVIGSRAYENRIPASSRTNARLLDYALRGGLLLRAVTSKPLRGTASYAPMPCGFARAARRVTDETAPATTLAEHAVFHTRTRSVPMIWARVVQ